MIDVARVVHEADAVPEPPGLAPALPLPPHARPPPRGSASTQRASHSNRPRKNPLRPAVLVRGDTPEKNSSALGGRPCMSEAGKAAALAAACWEEGAASSRGCGRTGGGRGGREGPVGAGSLGLRDRALDPVALPLVGNMLVLYGMLRSFEVMPTCMKK
ncbi:hypothetical protein ZWY2020_002755 [Hordeum vulgare]|nr:hypothetical protein ZWY2020_002755 [Hordeum vulgare]